MWRCRRSRTRHLVGHFFLGGRGGPHVIASSIYGVHKEGHPFLISLSEQKSDLVFCGRAKIRERSGEKDRDSV